MKVFIISIAFFLSGCASAMNILEDGPKAVARGVDSYCKETDPDFRKVFEAEVNARTDNSVNVTCN